MAASRYYSNASEPLVADGKVMCCIQGCHEWIARRRRGEKVEYCPLHGLSVSLSPTYVYRDYQRNFIIADQLLPKLRKVERWRLGHENSEDALTWNVFLSLSSLGALGRWFSLATGYGYVGEPELYLWGNKVELSSPSIVPFFEPLINFRNTFESGSAFATEPDVILRFAGKYIVLIEAKFGSENGTLEGKQDRFGTVEDFLVRYPSKSPSSDPLNREWIEVQDSRSVLEQLCRNAICAHHLAEYGEHPVVINLVRSNAEPDVLGKFLSHIHDGRVSFFRATWEDIASLPEINEYDDNAVLLYLQNKTLSLDRAFELPRETQQ